MGLNDIFGLGKVLPIDKLVDIVSRSVGRISKPYFDRKDIDTKAYEIEKLAEARAKEMKIIASAVKENFQLTGGIEYSEEKLAISSPKELPSENMQSVLINPTLEERTQERLDFQENKKQLNIENITAFAAEELKNESAVTDEPLDEDWTTRFFRMAEDISTEEMQALWGRILAGEIKQPKTFSLRTLELIRNLSKSEAATFMKVANLAIRYNGEYNLFKSDDKHVLSKKFNILYTDIALLIEIGLLQSSENMCYNFSPKTFDYRFVLSTQKIVLVANIKANTPKLSLPIYAFTNAGNELLKLVEQDVPFEYLTAIANSIKSKNIEVKYGHILSRDDNEIKHTQLQDFQ